jgi:predicted nucleic acid-binding protein
VKRLRLDANVVLRFLTGEPEELAQPAAELMRRAEAGEFLLVLSPLVVAEIVWVLKSFYRRSYRDIAGAVVPFLSADGVEVEEREVLIRAIELARDKNVDFADAVLALEAVRAGETVCTFDKTDFKRLPAPWVSPETLPR